MRRGGRRPRASGRREPDLFAPPAAGGEAPDAGDEALWSDMRVAEPSAPLEERIPGASAASAVRVSTLTQTAKDVLEGAFLPLWVRGEVTDFKAHRNGHWYFCLRDGEALVRCVVWSRDRWGIPAPPDEGMQVAAMGQLSVYPARGEMQFVVRRMEARGDGLRRKQLERTRARLAAEGLLAPERKRALPAFPRRVAVVTSPDGAALHDIAVVLRRRCPTIELVVVAARVQGENAPEELCAALERLARWGGADVAIIGRGGGGREDLWAFNDERVARAVAACPVPVVSAVGHEIDITICDLVADLRAPTPSAAAEAVSPMHEDMVAALRSTADAMRAAMDWHIERGRERLRRVARDTTVMAGRSAERRRAQLGTVAARLHALSPLATLARGFAVARGDDGRTLGRTADFTPGMPFDLLLADGVVRAKVRE